MQRRIIVFIASLLVISTAYAELQTVQVGGEVRIRGRYWTSVYNVGVNSPPVPRIAAAFLPDRAIGPFGTGSRFDWDDRGDDLSFVEQRTRLNVKAGFTQDVSAFIELEVFEYWGTDFRSNPITGVDFRTTTADDLEVYQSYIEAREMFGQPLRLRIGRQEIKLGKGWLADDLTGAILGRNYDAIRLTYQADTYSIDAWWSKLTETSPLEQDGDTDFSGIYATCNALDWMSFSVYWMWIRDGSALEDTPGLNLAREWVEDILGLDDYDPTNMHTLGARAWGKYAAWDYDLELAYQFGNADHQGFGFKFFGSPYGDDNADFNGWAGDLEIGYTFDINWSPRVYIGGAYFSGEDNRGVSFWDWLNPFDRPEASVSFNRLFPGKPYSLILEIGQEMSNFHQVRAGVETHPMEALTVALSVAYFGINEPFDMPLHVTVGGFHIPLVPAFSFLTDEADSDIGISTHLWARYNYSPDLFFRVGWERLFTGDGLTEGNFIFRYGLQFSGGTDDEDSNYFYFDTGLKF